MLEYISSQKDVYDYFDINPEIILVDDFDYILGIQKYDIQKHLNKYFSKISKFNQEISKHRKLVLTSSTLHLPTLSDQLKQSDPNEISTTAINTYKKYFIDINPEIIEKFETVVTPNFMNFDYHLKGLKFNIKSFEEGKNVFEKKIKQLNTLLNYATGGQTIVCCNDQSIPLLKEQFKKRNIHFISVDESNKYN
jgi:hypothetical protein